VFVYNTVLRCQVNAGVGSGHFWRVCIGAHCADSNPMFSTKYKLPVLSAVYQPDAFDPTVAADGHFLTEGGSTLMLEGDFFGVAGQRTFEPYGHVVFDVEPETPEMRFAIGASETCASARAFRQPFLSAGTQFFIRRQGESEQHSLRVLNVVAYERASSMVKLCGDGSGNLDLVPTPTVTVSSQLITGLLNNGTDVSGGVWELLLSAGPGAAFTNLAPAVGVMNGYVNTYNEIALENVGPGHLFTLADCHVVVDHTLMNCTLPEGVGHSFTWSVSVAGQRSIAMPFDTNGNQSLSYHGPEVTSVEWASGGSRLACPPCTTNGNERVFVSGLFFGSKPIFAWYGQGSARYGSQLTGATPPYTAMDCQIDNNYFARNILGWRIYRLECWTAPGVGKDLFWRVSVGGKESDWSVNSTSYLPPTLLTLGGQGSEYATTDGGQELIVSGTEFGPEGSGNVEWVIYGNSFQFNNDITFRATSCSVVSAHVMMKCSTGPGTVRRVQLCGVGCVRS